MRRDVILVVSGIAAVFLYVACAHATYRLYERRGIKPATGSDDPFSADEFFSFWKAVLWPVTLVCWFLFVLPRVLVLAIETRWRERKAVKAETPEAKVYR